jgi:hypothetical protein
MKCSNPRCAACAVVEGPCLYVGDLRTACGRRLRAANEPQPVDREGRPIPREPVIVTFRPDHPRLCSKCRQGIITP